MSGTTLWYSWVGWVFLVLFATDQWSKQLAVHMESAQINTGVSFGFLADRPWQWYAVVTVCALYVVWRCIIAQQRKYREFFVLSFCLLAVGGLSNLVDRVQYGGVVDFLWFAPLGVHNNPADWYIGMGVSVIVLLLLNPRRS